MLLSHCKFYPISIAGCYNRVSRKCCNAKLITTNHNIWKYWLDYVLNSWFVSGQETKDCWSTGVGVGNKLNSDTRDYHKTLNTRMCVLPSCTSDVIWSQSLEAEPQCQVFSWQPTQSEIESMNNNEISLCIYGIKELIKAKLIWKWTLEHKSLWYSLKLLF